MNTTRSVSAESRITFEEPDQPVITARSGIVYGHRFRLSGATLVVHATTQDDGTVALHTEIRPEVAACVANLDGITRADWVFVTVTLSQLPDHVRCIHDALVSTVHALHPLLRYADSPLALSLASEAVAAMGVPA